MSTPNPSDLSAWWASWCGPCRAFAPTYERAAQGHPDIVFGKIDTELERGLAAAFEIQSIPTLMVFRDGILVFARPGALPPAALEKLIAQVRALDMDAVRLRVAELRSTSPRSGGETMSVAIRARSRTSSSKRLAS